MADFPDGVMPMISVSVVAGEPKAETETTEYPVLEIDRLSTTSTDYATVVTWTVTADRTGVLKFVEMESDDYTHTRFKLEIGGTVIFTDQQFEASLSLEFPDLKLAAGSVVTLSAKSSDGTAVNVDGDIMGKEVG